MLMAHIIPDIIPWEESPARNIRIACSLHRMEHVYELGPCPILNKLTAAGCWKALIASQPAVQVLEGSLEHENFYIPQP